MYKLRDYLTSIVGLAAEDVSSEELYCTECDLEKTFHTNQMQESLAAYSYTLVCQGWLHLTYHGREMTLQPGDLYIYSPGFQVNILKGSEDYRSICLIADELITLESPYVWNIIRTAYYPISEIGQPVVRLSESEAGHLWRRMKEITDYLSSSHRFKDDCLRTLYTLFVLDLRNMMEQSIGTYQTSERTTALFINFMRLLPHHFVEHHDIKFYADQLHVTPTHLSRIVRQVTQRTVIDYINHMLLMESSWLLKTTHLSLAAIAERLHFADQSSFSKFFQRMKGISPKQFRSTHLLFQ